MTREQFKLTEHELQSALWLKLKAHLEYTLNVRRMDNDRPSADAASTAFIRGDISRLKALLALAKPNPAQVTDDS